MFTRSIDKMLGLAETVDEKIIPLGKRLKLIVGLRRKRDGVTQVTLEFRPPGEDGIHKLNRDHVSALIDALERLRGKTA